MYESILKGIYYFELTKNDQRVTKFFKFLFIEVGNRSC